MTQSQLANVFKSWFTVSDAQAGWKATNPDIDFTDRWNDFVNELVSIFGELGNLPILPGIQLTLKTLAAGSLIIPAGIYAVFFANIPWMEIFLPLWCVYRFPTWSIGVTILGEGVTIPIPLGLLYYFFFCYLDATLKVPISEVIAPAQSGNPTKYGGYTSGFSFKDLTYDGFMLEVMSKLVRWLGPHSIRAFQLLLFGYKTFNKNTSNDELLTFMETEFAQDATTTDDKLDSLSNAFTQISNAIKLKLALQ